MQGDRRESTRSRRGGTIHRFIDIWRYFSRNTYRDIISYNHNLHAIFDKVIPQIHNYFVKIKYFVRIFCENIL